MKLNRSATLLLAVGCASVAAAGIPVDEVLDEAGIDVGRLEVGGAIRANYIYGDYPDDGSGAPQRGANGGDVELDTFRINVDWEKDAWLGKAEYRWYTGYNFLHTAWLGRRTETGGRWVAGLNRVPFGVSPYGTADSWFFDLNYYIGLADDMDVGVKWSHRQERYRLDLAFYAMAEPNGNGASAESARYSYDIVDNGQPNGHYRECGQANARLVVLVFTNGLPTELGASIQLGHLEADNASTAENTLGYAAALHSSTTRGPWNLKLQLAAYDYRPDYNNPAESDDLVVMGAYDYAAPVASRGLVPAASLSHTWEPARFAWLDSVTAFAEASAILKHGRDNAGNALNDSIMNSVGVTFATGGWYTYVEYASATGNYFIGPGGDFGANADDEWQSRFNINLGYYF